MTLRLRVLIGCLVALVAGACGGSDSSDAETAPTSTVAAPLRPDLWLDATGGIGTIQTWIADWNQVEGAIRSQGADLPDMTLSADDIVVGTSTEGISVFATVIESSVSVGGAVQSDDGGVSALMVLGLADDPLFFAAYSVWLGTINPTIAPEDILPLDVAFGEATSNAVVIDGRSYEAVRTTGPGGEPLLTITMVAAVTEDPDLLAGSHRLLRSSLLQHLAEIG